ncbi:MAG: glycosyltransferase family 2 protein, partial [Propionicimonas sp.]|nr:glycosyltransferase family 2 protein [Propionicimonas sp.]
PVAVGYRMGKNPTSSWVAGTSSLFWLLQTRLFHLPRARRGLPVTTVGGTGWMFSLDTLGPDGWHTSSVCEDIEFTLNAIADGRHVGLAMDAMFYDEQPLTFAQSMKQRYRWSLGSVQVLGLVGPKLVKAVRRDWRRTLDALLFSIGIPIAGASAIIGVIGMVATGVSTGLWQLLIGGLLVGAVVSYVAVTLVAAWVLKLEHAHWPGAWQAALAFPIYVFSWSLLNVLVLFYRNPVWKTIPHVEAVEIDQLQAPELSKAPEPAPIPLQRPAS